MLFQCRYDVVSTLERRCVFIKDRCSRFQTWVCQNVSNEVLSAWFKFQAKIQIRSGVCVQGEWQKYTRLSPPFSKDERLKDIGHSMSIGNLILGVTSVTVSCLIRYDSLLQNATDIITKCDSYFITKWNRSLLQNAPGFLLQNTSFITKCDSYYKMRRLLQIATAQIGTSVMKELTLGDCL